MAAGSKCKNIYFTLSALLLLMRLIIVGDVQQIFYMFYA